MLLIFWPGSTLTEWDSSLTNPSSTKRLAYLVFSSEPTIFICQLIPPNCCLLAWQLLMRKGNVIPFPDYDPCELSPRIFPAERSLIQQHQSDPIQVFGLKAHWLVQSNLLAHASGSSSPFWSPAVHPTCKRRTGCHHVMLRGLTDQWSVVSPTAQTLCCVHLDCASQFADACLIQVQHDIRKQNELRQCVYMRHWIVDYSPVSSVWIIVWTHTLTHIPNDPLRGFVAIWLSWGGAEATQSRTCAFVCIWFGPPAFATSVA